ncbi:MAG: hypothetical protein IT162_17900 [Bryobacterales bacterium]|nr:hypothetical protein [Bryobacterales bacterium]
MNRVNSSRRRPRPTPEVSLGPPRHLFDIPGFAREALGFEPDPLQTRALSASIRRGILNCCRQWGKSTTVAIRAVHQVLHHPGSLVIVASPTARQSAELVRKSAQFLRRLGFSTPGDGQNPVSLALPNGSRIVGLPGQPDNIRGFSQVALLLIDEASRVNDEIYHSVRPMVAAHADANIWLLSTPNGRQGFFYREWHEGGPQWTRIEAPATQCPRIPADYLEEERRSMTDLDFRREYLCDFIAADHSYFDPASIDAAFYPEPAPPVLSGRGGESSRHFLGLDLGQARDYTGIAILERRIVSGPTPDPVSFARPTSTHIIVNHLERIPLRTSYPDVIERVRALVEDRARQKRRLEILMDATGVGAAVRDMLKRASLGVPVSGITITSGERVLVAAGNHYHVPRHDLLGNLRVLLEKRMLTVAASGPHVETLRSEFLRWGDRSAHDDLIFAVGLAAWKASGLPLNLDGAGPIPMVFPEVRK